jgi:DNA helicase HerA-like ATPase
MCEVQSKKNISAGNSVYNSETQSNQERVTVLSIVEGVKETAVRNLVRPKSGLNKRMKTIGP